MTKKSTQSPDFEAALAELESIVERMEIGEQTLEESLKDFERGMELSKQCQASLKQAQIRVEKMIPERNSPDSEPDQPVDD